MSEIELHREATQPTGQVEVARTNTGAAKIREAAEVMALCKQLADAVCNTGMMPKHLRGKPEETAAVMLYGATLDLDPMQSVRSIYEVHGQPGLYGRAMVALVLGRGHQVWTVESTDEAVTVAGRRSGSQHIEQVTWTIERAVKAGYVPVIDPDTGKYRLNKWGKLDGNEKYLTDPQSMLYAKAASDVCRRVAPDVLAGVYAVEELESERWDVEVVSPPRQGGLAAALSPKTATVEQVGEAVNAETGEITQPGEPLPDLPDSAYPEGAQPLPTDSPLLNTSSRLARAMYAAVKSHGIPEVERIVWLGNVIGREIDSSKDMTEQEARNVLSFLEQWDAEQAAKKAAEEAGES